MSFNSAKSAKSVSSSTPKSVSTPKSATSPRLTPRARSSARADPSAICATRLPRVPTSLECEWLDSRLGKSGRDGFLGAQTLSPRFLRKAGGMKQGARGRRFRGFTWTSWPLLEAHIECFECLPTLLHLLAEGTARPQA